MSAFLASILVTGAIYALLAYSFAIPVSVGVLYAGQMGTMAIGAYVTAYALLHGVTMIVASLLAVAALIVVAVIAIPPALRLGELSMAIVTLGIGVVVTTLAQSLDVVGGATGLQGVPIEVDQWTALAVLGVFLLGLAVANFKGLSRLMALVRDDPRVAAANGINVPLVKGAGAAVGVLLSGIAGVLLGGYISIVSPTQFSFSLLLQIIAFALVGGAATTLGPLVGTALLWVVPQYVSVLGDWRLVVYGVVIIVVMTACPDGLATLWYQLVAAVRRRRQVPALALGTLDPDNQWRDHV